MWKKQDRLSAVSIISGWTYSLHLLIELLEIRVSVVRRRCDDPGCSCVPLK